MALHLDALGMTVPEAAAVAGVSRVTAWRAREGLPVGRASAERLADALSLPADAVRRGRGEP